jgi:hypothetical protein
MTKVACVVLMLAGLPILEGCANVGADDQSSSDVSVIGNEKGGQIPRSVGRPTTSSAYTMVTAHCAKFGKKGMITRMDFESGTMTFECHQQTPKPGT